MPPLFFVSGDDVDDWRRRKEEEGVCVVVLQKRRRNELESSVLAACGSPESARRRRVLGSRPVVLPDPFGLGTTRMAALFAQQQIALLICEPKLSGTDIYISLGGGASSDVSAEIVFSGRAQPGATATNVNVEEVRMVVDEEAQGFGFTERNELINGKAAIIGLLCLLDFELLTGEGLLKGT
ncbi:hypothetical protein AgCh_012706 [Apium graveolens]